MKEKSQFEKNAAEKQVELLSEALNNAIGAGGHWLNATGKGYPKFYPKGVAVSPFNALFMALHSDKTGSETNLFTLYSEAKARGESVREHEKGVPFLFYNWNKYVNKNNPNNIISRNDYRQLIPEEKERYKGIHNREIRTLFNIDQTLLPLVDKKAYETLLEKYGNSVEQVHLQLRPAFSQGIIFLCQLATHFVNVIQRLFEGGEEAVQVILVRIDAITGLAFRLDIQCPTVFVILHHLDLLEPKIIRLFYRRIGINGGDCFQSPVF